MQEHGRLPEELRAQIAMEYQAGLDLEDVASVHGVNHNTVRAILAEYGVPIRRRGQPPVYSVHPTRNRGMIARQFKAQQLSASGVLACEACGWIPPQRFPTLITLHHILPFTCGGSDEPENLALLCPNCHAIAHAMFGKTHGRYFGPTDKKRLLAVVGDPEEYYEQQALYIQSLLR